MYHVIKLGNDYNRLRNKKILCLLYLYLICCNMIVDLSYLAFLRFHELIKEDSDFYIAC